MTQFERDFDVVAEQEFGEFGAFNGYALRASKDVSLGIGHLPKQTAVEH